ncbi:hypothetical protein [Brevundimonas sp.]|uniref:hypothetical protein n=1 Tax=Brevundimonas sp. TaxID=1871086 RepID=UPI003AF76214
MKSRRPPIWIRGAAAIVCLAGILAGPGLAVVGSSVWMALQPRTLVTGWDVIAGMAVFCLLWLAAVLAIARRLGGRAGWGLIVVAVAIAGAAVLFERLQPPGEVTRFTVTGEAADVWRDFQP